MLSVGVGSKVNLGGIVICSNISSSSSSEKVSESEERQVVRDGAFLVI